MSDPTNDHYDFIIVGSGFGGSVAGLRLVEKGWRVLMLEKGRRFAPEDFPKTNWDLRRWLWVPGLDFRGLFKMTFLRHITIFSGVGVGGGSLVYGNTHPVPKDPFFEQGSWAGLARWKDELDPYYDRAKRMLGVARNPRLTPGDEALREIARDIGREGAFEPTEVAVFFGEPGKTVPDPFFDGDGPPRTGCNFCGGCMTGCRFGAKNTLDKNYLFLAEKRGLTIRPQTEVTSVRAGRAKGSASGFRVETESWGERSEKRSFTADRVVLAGGVLGTVDLLLRMREDTEGLPQLSARVGDFVRTNSESLIAVTTERRDLDLSAGIAITSILHTDEHSHVEPVRYSRGSGFFRLLASPHAEGDAAPIRIVRAVGMLLRHPWRFAKMYAVPDFGRYTQILLYMRTLEGTLRFRRQRTLFSAFRTAVASSLADADAPRAFIPAATDIARRFAQKVGGTPGSLLTETLLGIPSTAHILGGACIGANAEQGVIDPNHEVYGYPGLYVVDGSAVSANPGVNPSLTIAAMAERAMAAIPVAPGHSAG